jgi:hypothetical protein
MPSTFIPSQPPTTVVRHCTAILPSSVIPSTISIEYPSVPSTPSPVYPTSIFPSTFTLPSTWTVVPKTSAQACEISTIAPPAPPSPSLISHCADYIPAAAPLAQADAATYYTFANKKGAEALEEIKSDSVCQGWW